MTSAISKTLKRSAWAFTIALGFAASANAQQSSGNIMGDAVVGETIVVHNDAIGFHREIDIEKDGRYTIRRVPTGIYVVTVKRADGSQTTPKEIRVQAGTTARVQ